MADPRRLAEIIEDAPHASHCGAPSSSGSQVYECRCWKAEAERALGSLPSAERVGTGACPACKTTAIVGWCGARDCPRKPPENRAEAFKEAMHSYIDAANFEKARADRAEAELRSSEAVATGYSLVRTDVLKWLHGEQPHPDTGKWFERPDGRQGAFWWRKELGAATKGTTEDYHQMLGAAIVRLRELGDTTFALPPSAPSSAEEFATPRTDAAQDARFRQKTAFPDQVVVECAKLEREIATIIEECAKLCDYRASKKGKDDEAEDEAAVCAAMIRAGSSAPSSAAGFVSFDDWYSREGLGYSHLERVLMEKAWDAARSFAPSSARVAIEEWREGEAPKDGQVYEMRRYVAGIAGAESDQTVWQWNGWWDGKQYVRRNQMHGGTEWLMLPTHWRPVPSVPPAARRTGDRSWFIERIKPLGFWNGAGFGFAGNIWTTDPNNAIRFESDANALVVMTAMGRYNGINGERLVERYRITEHEWPSAESATPVAPDLICRNAWVDLKTCACREGQCVAGLLPPADSRGRP